MGTHYAVLECDYNSPFDEIKKKYQELVLLHHPDKSADGPEKFLRITEAWNVLREPESRRRYDAELKHQQTIEQPIIYDTVSVKDLRLDDDTYYYPCRCGGSYTIPKDELIYPESLVQCDECSLSILINCEK